MATAIAVTQARSRSSFELNLDLGEEGNSVSLEQQEDTTDALLGFLDERARADGDLTSEEVGAMHLTRSRRQSVTWRAGGQSRHAELVGRRIRDLGDEFMEQFSRDPMVGTMVQNCIEDTDGKPSMTVAYKHFCEVVKTVFECDEKGVARRINLGRIAGVFTYCYYLCKTFIQNHISSGIMEFLGTLVGYLIRALVTTRFYDWLSRQGGWRQLLVLTERLVPGLKLSLNSLLLVGAVLLLGAWVYRRMS